MKVAALSDLSSRIVLFGLLALASCSGAAVRAAGPAAPEDSSRDSPPRNSLTVGLGGRNWNSDAWGSLDSPIVLDLRVANVPEDWPVGWELGFSYTDATGHTATGVRETQTKEFALGLTRPWEFLPSLLSADAGAGLLLSTATDFDDTSNGPLGRGDDSSSTFGAYARGGLFLHLSRSVQIGVEARIARAGDFNLSGGRRSGDYEELLLALRLVY